MKNKGLVFVLVLSFLVFLYGCDKLPFGQNKPPVEPPKPIPQAYTPTGTVIAKVNNYPITLEELTEEIERYNSMVPEDKADLKLTTTEQKADYLKDELIRRILFYQEALDRGLDRNPDIQQALEKTKQQLLVFQLVKDETDKINVTNQEIEDYYERAKESLKDPERRKVREIVVISQAQAKDLLIRLLQGEDFASLARQYSKASSADKGGDLGFIKPGEKFKAFDEVAFSDALEIDQFSTVFRGDDGYYIIKVEAKEGGKYKSLFETRDEIERGLTFIKQQKRLETLVGTLSSNAKIEVMEDKIK